jgi:RND family efflux transporter MFP subunit
MKKLIYSVIAIVFLVSCGQNADKQAELESLKSRRDKLNLKIEQLSAEINPTGETAETKGIAVSVEAADSCVFNHYIKVQGIVDGDQNIAVSPQMAGLVTAVYVQEGTQVRKGQVMAELDAQVLKQTKEEVKTQLELANNIFEKQAALWDKKIGSEVQYLQAKNSKESLERRLATVEEQMKMAQIISPIAGTVESVPLRVGQLASPGLPNSIIRVINMSVAKITAEVSEAHSSRIKDGDPAIVSFPDLGKEIETKLNFTSRFIDPTNRTFKVECKISPKDFALRANMIANVRIKDYTNENAFCIPVTYVQGNQTSKFIFIAKQNGNEWVAEKRNINIGMDYDGIVEVLDGIAAGEKIITAGYLNLTDGQKIIF